MKKSSIKYNVLLGLALLVGGSFMTSCLKNGQYYTNFADVNASVDLPLAAANTNGVVEFDFDSTTTTTSLPIYMDVASPSLPTKATTATLAIDTAYLSSYNTAHATNYLLPPASAYKVSTLSLSVPAGQRLDSANLTIDFTKLDLTQSYIVPFTIASSSLPIEQWNHLLIHPVIK